MTDLLAPSPELWETSRRLLRDHWYTQPVLAPWACILAKPVSCGKGKQDLVPLFDAATHPLMDELRTWLTECLRRLPNPPPKPPVFPHETSTESPPVPHPFSEDAVGQLSENPVVELLTPNSRLRRCLRGLRFAAAYDGPQAVAAAAPLAAPVHPERLAHWQRVLADRGQSEVTAAELAAGLGWTGLRSDGPLIFETARWFLEERRAEGGLEPLPLTAWWTKGISPNTVRPQLCLMELRLAAIVVGRLRAGGDGDTLKMLLFGLREL
jgi:hypothetical protein